MEQKILTGRLNLSKSILATFGSDDRTLIFRFGYHATRLHNPANDKIYQPSSKRVSFRVKAGQRIKVV